MPSPPVPVGRSLSDFLVVAIPCARAIHPLAARATSALKNSGQAAISPADQGHSEAQGRVLVPAGFAPQKDPRLAERRPVRAASVPCQLESLK
jgi:hypothetical protein